MTAKARRKQSDAPPPPREPVRRLRAYVPGEQPADRGIIKLNTNEFPYPPAAEVIEAVRREAAASLRLYPNPTAAPLREALAEELSVGPDWILVGNGSDEILRLVFQAYVGPGDRVAAADPTYSLYPVLAAMFEGRFAAHRTDPEGALPEALFKARARLFVIANPNPPLGALYSIRDLARLAQKRNSLLLIDEAYVAFAPCDCLSLAREHPNVVILRTFSKSHALAGMRVAYAVGRPAAIASLNKIRDSYNVNRVSQAAALAALRAKKYYKRKAEEIVATRERLRRALREMGYRVPRSSGNFVFARSGDGRRMMESLRERRILVRHFDEPGLRDGTRITIGTPQETDQLLAALRQIPAPQEAKP